MASSTSLLARRELLTRSNEPSTKSTHVCQQESVHSVVYTRTLDDEDTLNATLQYELEWQQGIDVNVGVISLINEQRDDVCFTCCQMLVLMNVRTKKYKIMNSHVNKICCLSSDSTGQYLITGSCDEVIVWDSYIGLPVLMLSPDEKSHAITQVAISNGFNFVFALTHYELYVWNRPFIKQKVHSNFAYRMNSSIKHLFVDPDNENYLCGISDNKVYFFDIVNTKHNGGQEIYVYTGESNRKYRQFSCGVYLKGTIKVLIGTNDGYITVWSSTRHIKNSNYAIGSSNKKILFKEIKLPRPQENHSRKAITSLKCSDDFVIAGDSEGEITIMNKNLNLLYWIDDIGISSVVNLSIQEHSDNSFLQPASPNQTTESDKQNLLILGKNGVNFKKHAKSEQTGNIIPVNTFTRNDVQDHSEVKLDKCPSMIKPRSKHIDMPKQSFYLNTFLEERATESSLERNYVNLKDMIVLGNQGELLVVDLVGSNYSLVLDRNFTRLKHISEHPKNSLVYVLLAQNTICSVDYLKQQTILQKDINTIGSPIKSENRQSMCSSLYEKRAFEKETNIEITYIHCICKSEITLILCGFANGMIWLLDDCFNPLCKNSTMTRNGSPVVNIISSFINYFFAVAHADGRISVYDLLDLRTIHFIHVYKAHSIITDMIMDGDDDNGAHKTTIVSIGEDRMLYLREISKQPEDNFEYGNTKILRIEQFARPLFIVSIPSKYFVTDVLKKKEEELEENSFYLVGTSEYKYRYYDKSSLKCIKTIQTPILRTPIHKIKLITELDAILFMSKSEIGMQKLPLDPLLHNYLYLTLPLLTHKVYFTSDNEHLISVDDTNEAFLLWKINTEQIITLNQLKYKHDLEPYCRLFTDGMHGAEFNKIKDLFLYFTLNKAGQNFQSEQKCLRAYADPVQKTIRICDLPFILSGLGYFPSEFELLMIRNETELLQLHEIDFEHFLILYLNHRPLKQVSYDQVLLAISHFGKSSVANKRENCDTCKTTISKEKLKEILMSKGEKMWSNQRAQDCVDFIFIDNSRAAICSCELASRLVEPDHQDMLNHYR